MDIDIQSFDIPRLVTVYGDNAGMRWWTKAWFNNREKGEPSVEIDYPLALNFFSDDWEKEPWYEKYFPKQMEIYHRAIEQTRQQLLG